MKSLNTLSKLSIILSLTFLMSCSKDENLEELAPYRSYVALISQQGTNAPVATILNNTTDLTITWTRIEPGKYLGTLSQSINIEKSTLLISTPPTHAILKIRFNSPTEIYFEAIKGINAYEDNFTNVSLEFKEYK